MMSIEEINSLPVFFIVGPGRSGTTLLRTVFDAHSNICIPPEGKVIMHLKNKYGNENAWNANKIDSFIEDLFLDRKFTQLWRVDSFKLKNYILSFPIEKLNFQVLCKMIYLQSQSLFKKDRILLIGDKNPVYSVYIEELLEIFPNAKFIHLKRDFRDVIVSNRIHFKRNSIAILSNYWRVYNHYIERSKSKHPSQFFDIRYEYFVNDPQKNVSELCQFLEIDFRPEMLTYYTTINENYKPEDFPIIEKMFPGLLTPIQPVTEKKWMKHLNEKELDLIYFVVKKLANRYQFDVSHSNSNPIKLILSGYGLLVQFIDIAVIKGYYILPFSLRKLIRKLADKLFSKAGILTVYNEDDRFTQKSIDQFKNN